MPKHINYEYSLDRKGVIAMDKQLNTRELARYLNLTEVTIYNYANKGKIPGYRIRGKWRFEKDKIDELLEGKGKSC